MTTAQTKLLDALQASLSGETVEITDEDALAEARQQAVLPLLSSNDEASAVIGNNVRIISTQDDLLGVLDGIPLVVLKGTAAAVYYPEPLTRTLGDIDLIVDPSSFQAAYQRMVEHGFVTADPVDDDDRHVHFSKDGIFIELHRHFAILQTYAQEQLLDQWILKAGLVQGEIDGSFFPMLPDELNGLTLLAHISQHLEEGLGLRHLIDWVMYVKHALPDEQWPAFREKTDQLGLTKLAKAVARLGQKYLGLSPDIRWCQDIPDALVEDLLEYAFECGNFGSKDAANNTVTMVMSHGRGFFGFFRNLQDRGKANWKLLKKASWLAPLAWAYQLVRYVQLGLKSSSLRDLLKDADASKRRNKLMDELGAKRLALRK